MGPRERGCGDASKKIRSDESEAVPSSRLIVVFYKSSNGREPVRDWLLGLDRADRREIGSDILAVQRGWPLGLPLCRSLGNGLWEVSSKLPSRQIARVIFAFVASDIILLHGFVKKTQKTPRDEIELALSRLKEVTA
jgi:phage-related protein